MDRFFSKLDLRDIKIDPRGSSFPPDADDDLSAPAPGADASGQSFAPAEVAPSDDPAPPLPPHAPTWAAAHAAAESVNGHRAEVTEASPAEPFARESNGTGHDALVEQHGEVLKVSARSRPAAVAGAIAGVVREAGRAEVQAIGAGATNQAVKAVAIARDYLRETGIDAVCLPAFIDVTIENEDRTAIRLVVEPR